jgi:transposase
MRQKYRLIWEAIIMDGLSSRKVAQKLGVSHGTIARWINKHSGRLEEVGILTIRRTGLRRGLRITSLERFVVFMREQGVTIEYSD